MKKILVLLLVSLTIFSCSKEKSKKWIVFDLDVVNTDTNEPEWAEFTLKYRTKSGINNYEEVTEYIGGSNVEGKFYKEIKVPRDAKQLQLIYYSNVSDYPPNWLPDQFDKKIYSVDEDIKLDEVNRFQVNVKPVYKYYLQIRSLNCFNETDTLWSTKSDYAVYQDGEVLVGCVDTLMGGPAVSLESKRTHYFRLKRDNNIYFLSKEIDFLSDSVPYEFNY